MPKFFCWCFFVFLLFSFLKPLWMKLLSSFSFLVSLLLRYKNINDIAFESWDLTNLFISSNSSFLDSLVTFPTYISRHLWIKTVLFLLSSPIYSFIYFCLIVQGKVSRQCWVEVEKVDIHTLFSVLRGKAFDFSFFDCRYHKLWGFCKWLLSDWGNSLLFLVCQMFLKSWMDVGLCQYPPAFIEIMMAFWFLTPSN